MNQASKRPVERKRFHIMIELPDGAQSKQYHISGIEQDVGIHIPTPSIPVSLQSPLPASVSSDPLPSAAAGSGVVPPASPTSPAPPATAFSKTGPILILSLLAGVILLGVVFTNKKFDSLDNSPARDTTAVSFDTARKDTTRFDTTPVERTQKVALASSPKVWEENPRETFERAEQSYRSSEYSQALLLYLKAAQAGNAKAQFQIGFMHLKGLGTGVDYSEAVNWFRKSASGGNAEAMRFLGDLYSNGDGVQKDLEKARSWYQKAAAHGDIDAHQALEAMDEN